MICRKIPLENVDLCDANSVEKRENMAVLTDILIIPAGCWTSVHHARGKQSISVTATLKRDVFGIIVRGLLTIPVLGSEQATRGQGRNPWQQWSLN